MVLTVQPILKLLAGYPVKVSLQVEIVETTFSDKQNPVYHAVSRITDSKQGSLFVVSAGNGSKQHFFPQK